MRVSNFDNSAAAGWLATHRRRTSNGGMSLSKRQVELYPQRSPASLRSRASQSTACGDRTDYSEIAEFEPVRRL